MRRHARIASAVVGMAAIGLVAACGGTAPAGSGSGSGGSAAPEAGSKTVTVYTADGLKDWYAKRFKEFQDQTGIAVQTVEAGSGEVVNRLDKEKSNPQADVLVTLPPYIQRAAQQGLLVEHQVPGADQVPAGQRDPKNRYAALINNYLCFIYNPDLAKPEPKTWDDLLDGRFKGKLQYSTPGQAGDGTAVLLQLQHVLGDQGALDYLKRLEANNVGPSASTGKLQPKVAKGELTVANGDVQMNLATVAKDKSNFKVFFPADAAGKRSTFAIPYYAGLATGAPHADAGKKLLEFLFSAKVQETVPESYGAPTRADVKPEPANGKQVAELMTGVELWQPDWDKVLGRLDADIAAYGKAVGR